MVERLTAIAATAWLIVAAAGAGRVLGNLFPASLYRAEALVLRILAGCGIISLALFLIGQFVFSTSVVVAVFACASLVEIASIARQNSTEKNRPRATVSRDGALALAIAGSVLFVLLVSGLALPAGDAHDDVIGYHLLGAKQWIVNGLIQPVLDQYATTYPATMETLFAALMAIANPRAPGFFCATIAVMLVVQVYSFALHLAQRVIPRHSAPALAAWCTAIVTTTPVIMFSADRAFVDIPFAAFALGALRVTLAADDVAELIPAAVLAGLTAGTKYTGPIVIVVTAILLFLSLESRGFVQRMRLTLAFCVVAAATGCAWYLRNWIVLGSPIYPPPPGMLGMFSTPYMSTDRVIALHEYFDERGRGLGHGPMALLLLPWNATFRSGWFHGAGGIGLIPLALAPLGIWVSRRDRDARLMILWAALLIVSWFCSIQEARFFIHALCIWALFGSIGLACVLHAPSRVARTLAWATLAVSVAYGFSSLVKGALVNLHSVASPAFEAQRRRSSVPFFDACEFLNTTPGVRRVLILSPHVMRYYLDKPYVMFEGSWGEHLIAGVSNANEALDRAEQLDVTHMLDVEVVGRGFVFDDDPRCQLVFSSEKARVYRILATTSNHRGS